MATIDTTGQGRSKSTYVRPNLFRRFVESRNGLGFLFMLPAAVFLLCFLTYPLGLGVWLGFTDTTIGRNGVWIGFENYAWLFDDPVFWLSVYNTILYTFVGGFLAVSWTDTVQATLMFFALILTPIFVVLKLGGPETSIALVEQVDPANLQFFKGATVLGVVSLLAWGLGYVGQPHILARFMAAESVRTIPAARRIAMTWMVLCLAGAMGVGFFGIAWFEANPARAGAVADNPERVFIELSTLLFNPWIAGVLLSAILAAVMSTLSCQLLVCSSAITEDFYKGFLRPKAGHKELVWVGRFAVLAVAMLAIWLAADPDSRVLGLVSYAWAGFGAAFGPVVVLSLFWKGTTRNGALAGMIVGALVVIGWKQLDTGLYEMVPGVALATLAIVLVSRFGSAPSPAMLGQFDAVHAELRRSED